MSELETDRLHMRPFGAHDLDLLAALHGDTEVMATMRSGVQKREQVRAELERYVATWNQRAFGIRALFDKASGAFVGECGLWLRDDGQIGLRFALSPRARGRGLAFEAVRATLDHAFGAAGIERVVAVARAVNARSRRVMEKAGMRLERRYPKGDIELTIYAVSRDGWLAMEKARRRGAAPA